MKPFISPALTGVVELTETEVCVEVQFDEHGHSHDEAVHEARSALFGSDLPADLELEGSAQVGVGITADGAGMGAHGSRFFVGFYR